MNCLNSELRLRAELVHTLLGLPMDVLARDVPTGGVPMSDVLDLEAAVAEALACAESCRTLTEELAQLQHMRKAAPALLPEPEPESPAAVAHPRSPPASLPASPLRTSSSSSSDEEEPHSRDTSRVSRRTMTRRFVATALEAHWLESERCGRRLTVEATSWLRRREAGQLAGTLRRDAGDHRDHWSVALAAEDGGGGGREPTLGGTFLQQLARPTSPIDEADQFEETRARIIAERDDVLTPRRLASLHPTAHDRVAVATSPAPELCVDALEGVFMWLDETSLAMAMHVSRSWLTAARASLSWGCLGARRWSRPAAPGTYPRSAFSSSGGPGPVHGSSTWPSEWQAMCRTLDARDPERRSPYRVWLWGVRRVAPAKRRLAELHHSVACARSLLRKLDLAASGAPANDPDIDRAGRDAGILADAQRQVVDLERELACTREEVKRLLGLEPEPSEDQGQMERFKLIDVGGGGAVSGTGQQAQLLGQSQQRRQVWSRVTMLGARVERYSTSIGRGTSAWMD
eukprot:COSAG06_NODE_2309_length_7109_cov_5.256205_2_plen_517_part_00